MYIHIDMIINIRVSNTYLLSLHLSLSGASRVSPKSADSREDVPLPERNGRCSCTDASAAINF